MEIHRVCRGIFCGALICDCVVGRGLDPSASPADGIFRISTPGGAEPRPYCALIYGRTTKIPELTFGDFGADEGIFPRASQHHTVVLTAHCGAPPCSNPLHRKTKQKHRSGIRYGVFVWCG